MPDNTYQDNDNINTLLELVTYLRDLLLDTVMPGWEDLP